MIGNIHEVSEEITTTELLVAAVAGNTVLKTNSVAEFSQGGGTLRVNWTETVNYTTVDPLTGWITLATPIAANYPIQTRVQPMPEAREKTAMVMPVGAMTDAIDVVVPHALYDKITSGIRTELNREVISYDIVNGRFTIIDVLSKPAVIETSYIGSDDTPPGSSPTPSALGGLGSIFVKWDPVANNDPVIYEVHMSVTTGFTPGPTTLHTKTAAGSASIRALPDGSALSYSTPYYFKIVATDKDGAAPASAQATANMFQINSPDVAADYVYANTIYGSQILSDTLQATLTITGMLKTAISGRRVELDSTGLKLFDSDGVTRVVDFPTTGTQPASIQAKLTALSLTVQKDLVLMGVSNFIKGTLKLADGISTPGVAPSVWESHQYVGSRPMPFGAIQYGLTPHLSLSTILLQAEAFFGGGITSILRSDGSQNPFPLWGGTLPWQTGFNPVGGITTLGSNYFLLGVKAGEYYVYKLDSSFAKVAELDVGPAAYYPGRPTIGNDGTNILVAYAVPNDTIRVVPISTSLVAGTNTDLLFTNIFSTPLAFIGRGNFGYGANRYVVSVEGYGTFVYDGSTLALQASNTMLRANNAPVRGMWWDGTRFWSGNEDGTLWKHGVLAASRSCTATYTWYDGDTSSGSTTHESLPSPVTSFAQTAGTFLNIRTEEAPDSGLTDPTLRDKANRVGIYVGLTTPRRLQSYLGIDSGSRTIRDLVVDAVNTGSAVEPSTNGFLGASNSPGVFQTDGASTSKGITINGNGSIILGGPVTGDAVNREKIAYTGANVNLSGTTNVTIPTITFTRTPPASATVYEVTLQSWLAPTATHTILLGCLLNGVEEPELLVQAGNGTTSYTWVFTGLTAGASYTWTFRARMAAGGQTGIVAGVHTSGIMRRTG